MKFFLMLGLLVLGLTAQAQSVSPKLLSSIADAVDSLHGDTVNEGEMSAYVSTKNGTPDMTCSLSLHREPGKGLAKCTVTFDVESNYSDETQHCSQECFLIHVYDLKTLKILKRVESLSQSCMEKLSSGCE